MKPGDLEYYRARLAAEQAAVETARHPLAAESHRRLAEGYELRLRQAEPGDEQGGQPSMRPG